MNIQSSFFIKSSNKKSQLPFPKFPEYALIGRSNVGKSTLINILTKKKKIAKTSSIPGKTQSINHYLINKEWYLVDLPGYGYIKNSKKKQKNLKKVINNYISYRKNLVCLFILIDSRLNPQKIDLEFLKKIEEKKILFCIIFTKIDKLTSKKCKENIKIYNNILLKEWKELPHHFKISKNSEKNRIKILNYIKKLNKKWKSYL